MTGLAAAGQALDIVKKLRDLEKNFDAATYRMEIANLMMALSDTRIALADAQTTIAEKDAEIRRLSEVAASKVRTVKFQGFAFGIDADGKQLGLPFCPACIANTGKQVHIVQLVQEFHQCPICKAMYNDPPRTVPASLLPSS